MTGSRGEAHMRPPVEAEVPHDPSVADELWSWLRLDERLRAIVRHDGRLVWANEAARAHLRDDPDFRLLDDVVRPVAPLDAARFAKFLNDCTRGACVMVLPRSSREGHVVITARRSEEDAELVWLTFQVAGPEFHGQWADLSQAFRLTPMEQKIVLALLGGMGADLTAARLGLALDTVRTHIRNAYAKLGVSSREALFNKLEPYRLN